MTGNLLLDKLDAFIRKYYRNEMLKGGILAFGLMLSWMLLLVVLEYFGRFSPEVRTVLFSLLVVGLGGLFSFYIVRPLLKILSFGKRISHTQAATIVGNHFPEVKDKLLNTLQLQEEFEGASQGTFVYESIQQRIKELSPVPFGQVIQYKKNRKYAPWALIPVLATILILSVNASILVDGSKRIVNYNNEYLPEAPFDFELQNNRLEVLEQEPFMIDLKLRGSEIPAIVNVEIDGKVYRMDRLKSGVFQHQIIARNNMSFRFSAGGFKSKSYDLKVLPKPSLKNFSVVIEYPAYTGRKNEVVENNGDLFVPEGTKLTWRIASRNTDKVEILYGDSSIVFKPGLQNEVSFARKAKKSLQYAIMSENKYVRVGDSVFYNLQVIPDLFPSISVDERKDSLNPMVAYFMGEISDDYGLNGLSFHYRIKRGIEVINKALPVSFNRGFTNTTFVYYFDLNKLELNPGDLVEYNFVVSDNDQINGSKSTASAVKMFKAPTVEELEKMHEASNEQVKNSMEKMLNKMKNFQKDVQQFKQNMQEAKKPDWKQKNQLEDLLKRQQELQKEMEKIQQEYKKDLEQMERFDQIDEETLKKQEMLEKLMEELLTDEIKKLMEEIREMMEKSQKEKVTEKLEDLTFNMEDYQKQLDRALEQFKQMEFEEKLEKTLDKLNDIKDQQEELNKETESGKKKSEELEKQQEKLNEKFDGLMKDIEKMQEMNEEMQNKRDMEGLKEKAEEAKEQMEKSEKQLEENKQKNAGKNQKDAQQKMQEMKEQMQSMQMAQQQQNSEDMDALRDLLENIVRLSFDQEEVMAGIKGLDRNDPKYFTVGQRQRKLRDDAGMIRDSLFALSKRVPQIQSFVNKEISAINRGMDKSLVAITSRQSAEAMAEQQTAMTSLNNLALMLAETLDQMQQQAASSMSMPGSGQCNKPGGASPKPNGMSMSQMQQQLQKQMEKMKDGMEKGGQKPGQKPGGQKPGGSGIGNDGEPGEGGMSSEGLAKMAAEQAALRKKISEMRQEMNKDGSGSGNGLKEIEKMLEQNEEDIINRRINPETIRRQNDIITRLLEHDRAERERDMDEKRESKEAKDELKGNLDRYFEYNRSKSKEIELLRTIPPDLRPYYKNKVNQYFNGIQ